MTLHIENKDLALRGRFPKIIRLQAEYYEWINDLGNCIAELRREETGADLFTIVQKVLPENRAPAHSFYRERECIAVVKSASYDQWWDSLRHETQVKIRKARKRGVETRVVSFDDEMVKAIKNIYDESPIRQGKPFAHYKESLEVLKKEHATFLDRSQFIGAFYEGEMIGFAKIVHQEGFSSFMQILAMVGHRDKAPTNALLDKAVELCAKQGIPYLQYGAWSQRGLGEFKENHGFEPVEVPRYYVPLNLKGEIALRLKLHRRLPELFPTKLVGLAADAREKWYSARFAVFGDRFKKM